MNKVSKENVRLNIAAVLLSGFVAKGTVSEANIKHALSLADKLIKTEEETALINSSIKSAT